MLDPGTGTPPPRPDRLPLALILTFTVLGAFLALGSPVQLLHLGFGVWFTEAVVFFGLSFVVLRSLGRDPVRETGLDSTTPRALALGAAIGVANYLAWAVPLMAAAQQLLPPRLVELFDGSAVFLHQSGPELAALVAGLGLAAPLGEEFFFRGVLQRGLGSRLQPSAAIVVTALVFSAFHLDPVGFFARFELGVVFGLLAWRAGSIWPAVAAHSANNLVATALFAASGEASEAELSPGALAGLWAAGNALLVALAVISRGRLTSPRPGAEADLPPVPLWRGAWPWAAASLLGLGLVLGLDGRGVELRLYEQAHPLKPALARDPALEALRRQVRAGELPLEAYSRARDAAAAAAPQTKE